MAYEFLGPRKIIAGENSLDLIPNEIKTHKKGNPLIVTDSGIVRAGILDRLISIFEDSKIAYQVFPEVQADPDIAIMENGIKTFQRGDHDMIIALGGGSSIDTAKVISVLATNEGEVRDYGGLGAVFKNDPVPHIAIPTTAGTGSEVTQIAVVTDSENNRKLGVKSPQLLPAGAVLDPTLLRSLPPDVIAHTGVDAFSHALESFLSIRSGLMTQELSLSAARLIYQSLIPFKENPGDMELASKMLCGSCLAGIAFSNGGLGAAHALAHALGSHHHLPHGLTCALFLVPVLRENRDASVEKYEIFYGALGYEKKGLSKEACADRLIEVVDEFMRKVGMPPDLKSMGIAHEVSPEMVQEALQGPTLLANPKKLGENQIRRLLEGVR